MNNSSRITVPCKHCDRSITSIVRPGEQPTNACVFAGCDMIIWKCQLCTAKKPYFKTLLELEGLDPPKSPYCEKCAIHFESFYRHCAMMQIGNIVRGTSAEVLLFSDIKITNFNIRKLITC